MLFPTAEFAVFLVAVLTANVVLLRRPTAWKVAMLAASYVFYGAWNWRFTGLLAASTVGNQLAAIALARVAEGRARRAALTAAVAFNLGMLGWFKYYGFFASSARNTLAAVGVEAPLPLYEVVLPVGISFFTFQALSYVVDVHRGRLRPASWLDFAVFLAFFPQLVAGPIVRGSEFLPQLRARDAAGGGTGEQVEAARAFGLIAGGLFKKVVVANALATSLVDPVFADPDRYAAGEVLAAVYGYAVQIYADFSGYTDIAIGVALLLGLKFPQNFDAPYTATSLRDFWRRWHMTLSRWLRDYLYIPLGGNRGSRAETYRNLMLTMLLGGLWHGAGWTFVVWGGLHGAGLACERFVAERRRAVPPPNPAAAAWRRAGARLATFHFVCLGWVFFRADSVTTAATILERIFTSWGPAPAVTPAVVALVAAGIAVQFVPRNLGPRLEAAFARMRPVPMGATLGVGLLAVDALGPQGVAPFIYFQF